MVRGQDRKNETLEQVREEEVWKDQILGQVALEPCPLLMQVHPLLHPGMGPVKLVLLSSGNLRHICLALIFLRLIKQPKIF